MLYKIESFKSLEERGQKFFNSKFGSPATVVSMAPGRVNLIGEHTDYNNGFVLPMALPMVTMVLGSRCSGSVSRIATDNAECDDPKFIEVDRQSAASLEAGKPRWANYLKGVLVLHPRKDDIPAFNAVVVSSLPSGGGLSSSAALEVAFFKFVDKLLAVEEEEGGRDLKEMALLCQKVEHTFAKVPCGIMDQLVCSIASQKQALLIDCRSLDVKQINLSSVDVTLLIVNSNVKHDLGTSEYAVRRQQCERACQELGVASLRDVSLQMLHEKQASLDAVCLRRARHVVSENERCVQSARCLEEGSFEEMGGLMKLSHASLRDDYNVSCKELDALVEMVSALEGVYGTRMTGGGFGGCTVTLLKRSAVEQVIESVQKQYQGTPSFYTCALHSRQAGGGDDDDEN